MELPSHHGTDDSVPDQRSATPVNWGTVLGITVAATLVAVMVILHLTGVVGPGAH